MFGQAKIFMAAEIKVRYKKSECLIFELLFKLYCWRPIRKIAGIVLLK